MHAKQQVRAKKIERGCRNTINHAPMLTIYLRRCGHCLHSYVPWNNFFCSSSYNKIFRSHISKKVTDIPTEISILQDSACYAMPLTGVSVPKSSCCMVALIMDLGLLSLRLVSECSSLSGGNDVWPNADLRDLHSMGHTCWERYISIATPYSVVSCMILTQLKTSWVVSE